MKQNLHTPATADVVMARTFAADLRVGVALFGGVLLAVAPGTRAHPIVAAVGIAILALTALLHRRVLPPQWLRVEEPLACLAGVPLIVLGPEQIDALTLLWMTSAALGVLGRGGRASAGGRLSVVLVLASPAIVHGPSADALTLFVTGIALLLAVGRVSNETSELLRDPLTGVLSRAALESEADRLLTTADDEGVAVVLIDLDDFGAINKRDGHRAGDERLRAATVAVESSLRRTDVLGRIGGDEFVVLAAGDGPTIGRRVLDALDEAGIAASIGIARSPGDADTVGGLLEAADAALRASKIAGKGRLTVVGG